MDNIYLVFKDGRFVIYNPKRLLEEGTVDQIEANGMEIYKLFSSPGGWKGYAIYRQKEIVLLNYMDTEVSLKKVSEDAIYTYSE